MSYIDFDGICANYLGSDDCRHCPFRQVASRNETCRQWAEAHPMEANRVIADYVASKGKRNDANIGRTPNGTFRQICRRCQRELIVERYEVFKDDYTGKYVYVCPHCHEVNPLLKKRKPAEDVVSA